MRINRDDFIEMSYLLLEVATYNDIIGNKDNAKLYFDYYAVLKDFIQPMGYYSIKYSDKGVDVLRKNNLNYELLEKIDESLPDCFIVKNPERKINRRDFLSFAELFDSAQYYYLTVLEDSKCSDLCLTYRNFFTTLIKFLTNRNLTIKDYHVYISSEDAPDNLTASDIYKFS